MVDSTGRQIAYAGPFNLKQANYADAEWFNAAMSQRYYISDVFLGLRGVPHFIVTVRNEWNGIFWVLRATIDFQAFNILVENIRIGETGQALILNRKAEPQTRTNLDIDPHSDLYREIMNEKKNRDLYYGLVTKEQIGREMIYVIGFLNDDNWALIYQQNTADAFADFRQARWIDLVVFLIGGICIIVMAIILSRRMVGKIAEADQEIEMMNQQMIERGKLASLGELAAGIAHEINNPVAIMVEEAGWIGDILEDEEFHESENMTEFKRALSQIRKQGIRCRDITHKLLSFARGSDARIQTINVNELVQEVVGLFAQQAKYSGVTIRTRLKQKLPFIQTSPTEIQQVLFNLLNNALHALDSKGGGEIEVCTAEEGGRLLLEVSDNGPGIPQVNLSRIFDPFFTTKPVGKGTGLGLSICYGIMNKMGGDIEVSSQVGEGTRFCVYFPQRSREDEVEEGAVAGSHPEQDIPDNGHYVN